MAFRLPRAASITTLVVACGLLVGAPRAWAGVDIFVKIDGIEGGSTAPEHVGEIDALGIGQDVANPNGLISSGDTVPGRSTFSDLSIVKRIDKATPKLFEASAKGDHLPTVSIVFRQSGESKTAFFGITLSNVLISSIRMNAGPEGVTEYVTVAFAKICWTYTVANPGAPAGEVKSCWDVVENKQA